MEMISIALEKKRCFLHATQSTHFTIILFIIEVILLSYIRPHWALNTNLGQVQQDTNQFMKGGPIASPNIAHQTPMPQTAEP